MKKIVVIEDEEFVRLNIVELLERKGHAVVAAADGKLGVSAAKKERPDLIISDIRMPNLDGYGVLNAVRADPQIVNTPFIFLTAKADQADITYGRSLGADDYLTKPYSNQGLLDAVTLRLYKHRTISELQTQAQSQPAEITSTRRDYLLLRVAAVQGDLAQIEQISERLQDLDQPDEMGNTPLMYAVMMRRSDIIRFLIDHGADALRINTHTGFSILKTAESMGMTACARYMRAHNRSRGHA